MKRRTTIQSCAAKKKITGFYTEDEPNFLRKLIYVRSMCFSGRNSKKTKKVRLADQTAKTTSVELILCMKRQHFTY